MQVLGVDVQASASEIRRAYLKLSLKFHPDKNGGRLEAHAAFRDLQVRVCVCACECGSACVCTYTHACTHRHTQDAYEIIGDPEKRSVFDDFGR